MAGRLKHFYKAWKVLTGDQNLLTIEKGCQISFLCQPNQEKILGNLKFNQKEKEAVSADIENFLKVVAIEKVLISACQEGINF